MSDEERIGSLQAEVAALRERIGQMAEIGEAFADIDEVGRAEVDQLRQSETQLRKALHVSTRQLREISRAVARYLPHTYPLHHGIAVSATCRPCADVGGDFYDFYPTADGRAAICMADVAGHGAAAAMLMAVSRALLRTAVSEEGPTGGGPSAILLRCAAWLQLQVEAEQFLTAWLGIWDPSTSTLRYASAAHPPAILWRQGGEPEFLPCDNGLPLGLTGIPPMAGSEGEVRLEPGDRVFLYTDAWTESESANGKALEGAEFLDFIANSLGQPLNSVTTMLFQEFERFTANTRIRDDVSLMVLERQA